MSIHQVVIKAYKHQILEDFNNDKYLPKTVDGLLEFLTDNNAGRQYVVYHYKNPYTIQTSIWQRLNRFWVLPCLIISMPFTWLVCGKTGVNTHSKFGKWLAKITRL